MAETGHGYHIQGTLISKTSSRKRTRCGGPGVCSECTTDAIRALTRITITSVKALTAISGVDGVLDVTLDREQILGKVLNALRVSGVSEQQAHNAIISMQNEGILFRERVP